MTKGMFAARVGLSVALIVLTACGLRASNETRIARAQQFMAQADYQSAMIELKNVLDSSPNEAGALLLAGQVSLQLGNPERADQFAQAAAAAGAPAAKCASLQADSALALGRFEPLLKLLDTRQLILPEPARNLFRAQALLGMRRSSEAAEAFQSVITRDPQSLDARIGLARVHLAIGDAAQAAAELDTLLVQHKDSAEGWWARALTYGAQGQYAPMERALVQANALGVRQLPQQQRAAVLTALVEARLAQANVNGAAKAQSDLNRMAPFALATPYMGARIAMARQDYVSAGETLTRLLSAAPEFSPARFLLGASMLAQGNLNQAELHLAQVVSESPENTEARKLLAQVRLRLDRPGEAVQALTSGAGSESDDPQIRALLGIAQLKSGDRDTAVGSLERGVREKPGDRALRSALVAAYLATGQKSKAVSLLQQALAREPTNIQVPIALAEISLREGDRPAAIRTMEAGIERDPASIDARLLLLRLYLRERQTTKADALVAQTLQLVHDRADVLAALGNVDLESGRYDQALGRYRAAAERDPNNAAYWLSVGRAQLALSQAGAGESVERALKLHPGWLPAVAAMALIELRAGHGTAALERVGQARKAAPGEQGFAVLEGDLRMAMKQFPEAVAAYQAAFEQRANAALAIKLYQARSAGRINAPEQPLLRWLDKHAEDSAVRSVLAEAYRNGGHLDKAIGEYERLIQLASPSPSLLNNLAWVYFLAGDPRAARVAKQAYDREPLNAAIADTYGWILVESARIPEGLGILKTAAEAAPGQPDIQYHYAAALVRVGRQQEAQERLQTLLKTQTPFPSRAQAVRLLNDTGTRQ